MDKRNKKLDRPKLRKEDIGIPVNFKHVQHVGFGQREKPPTSTQSACTSPSFENMDGFFNQENFRKSGKFNPGKENRFSNSSGLPPYSSMSNLSMMGNSFDAELGTPGATGTGAVPLKFAGVGKQKSAKSSFSGSLLNLNFFPFSKSSSLNVQQKSNSVRGGSKSEHDSSTIRSKRLSLGIGFPIGPSSSVGRKGSMSPRPLTAPPETPTPEGDEGQWQSQGQQRLQVRRRSSSFNGESDAVGYSEIVGSPVSNPLMPPSLTLNRYMGANNKKQKMGSSPPSDLPPPPPPPLSPDYDMLPPPPEMSFSSGSMTRYDDPRTGILPPESPSYTELPPPPPMKEMFPLERKLSLEFSYPATPNATRKLSGIPATPNGDMPPPPSPPSTPPPLPTSPPPSLTHHNNSNNKNRVGYSLAPLRAKLVRVNAPTLPPLSVPLLRPKSQSPAGTPSTWPLEPGLYSSTSGGVAVEKESCKKFEDLPEPPSAESLKDMNLSIERIQEACNHNSTTIDSSHIEPLSKLFQCRLSHKEWPTMMTKLFENSKNGAGNDFSKDAAFAQVYNEIIQNTLELWLRLEGGQSTLENVVTAFEQTQSDLSQDCNEHVTTKL